MSVQKWKDSAELVALVAVIGSLLAVVIELRQTQAALQAQTYQERAFDAIDFHLQIAANPVLSIARLEAADFDFASLSPIEQEAAESLITAIMIDADNEHYQYQRGFLDEDFYIADTVETIVRFAPVWRRFGIRESRPEFRAEVDRVLSGPAGR
ncbi:MAG: hypothetical protein R3315_05690 [Woeseiaceae bacterium]|nr:hypothetical protein [Woeseiaceae bacterium]